MMRVVSCIFHGAHLSAAQGDGMSVHVELVYALVSADGATLYAQAESWDSLLCAAQTLRDDGEDVGGMVVERSGSYDGALTAAVQDGIA